MAKKGRKRGQNNIRKVDEKGDEMAQIKTCNALKYAPSVISLLKIEAKN